MNKENGNVMKLRIFCLSAAVMMIGACEHMDHMVQSWQGTEPVQVSAPAVVVTPLAHPKDNSHMDTPELMSNNNVIVYPITGDITDQKQTFAQYRGVVENTTAGGYTVFDPSVTVYAVEGQGMKPAYLPDYSVPQYAQQYAPAPMPNAPIAIPMMVPSPPTMPGETFAQTPSTPVPLIGAKTLAGQRSGPVLTGY